MAVTKFPRPMVNNPAQTFAVDDGTKEITLVNSYGKVICKLHIRTGDISILDRYNSLMNDFDQITKPLSRLNLKNDGTASFDKDWAALKKVEGILKQKLNDLFDMDEADDIFATRNPFSSIGGEFFIEKVLKVLGDAFTQAVQEEAELSKKRVEKYMNGTGAEQPEVLADARTPTDNT